MRAAVFSPVVVLLFAASVAPRVSAGGVDAQGAATPPPPLEGVRLNVPIPVVPDVEVFTPSSYSPTGAKKPLLVFLHGFCLPDAEQQEYSFTGSRASATTPPRQQSLSQVGLRDLVETEDFVYVTPTAPHATRYCALCNVGEDSPNVGDRLTVRWINSTLARTAPAFACPAWDGSDACCNPELGGRGDDASFVKAVVYAVVDRYAIDTSRIYLMGIATGGFMANRMACEYADVFAGVATFAGGVWADADKCVAGGGGENGVTNVLNVHGDGDLTVPIGGGVNFAGVPFPSADQTVDTFARKFGCDALPREVAAADDGDDFSLPSDGRRDVDVSVTKFEGCGADGAYVVEQWTLAGVDHFMQEKTSRGMFKAVVQWLTSKRRAP